MKFFLAITSCTALASALTTSANKKQPEFPKGKKEKKITATFDDLTDGGSAYEPNVRYKVPQTYQFLVYNGFSVGKHDQVDDINIWRDHNNKSPGPASFGISKFYEPEIRSFDLKKLTAACFSSAEDKVGGGAVGCDIEFKGIVADDDGKPSGEKDVTYVYTYRITKSGDGSGVSTQSEDMHCVKLPDDFEGLKKVEVKIVDHSSWGSTEVKPKMVFDDITYKVHGKHL